MTAVPDEFYALENSLNRSLRRDPRFKTAVLVGTDGNPKKDNVSIAKWITNQLDVALQQVSAEKGIYFRYFTADRAVKEKTRLWEIEMFLDGIIEYYVDELNKPEHAHWGPAVDAYKILRSTLKMMDVKHSLGGAVMDMKY